MKLNKNLVTQSGLKNLKEELNHLLTVIRPKINEDIQKAKEFGDLSENAAYTSAVEARDLNEARIAELENLINNSKVVVASKSDDGQVTIGSTVILKNEAGTEMTFTIVGIGEGDPLHGKVTPDTPIAAAILGKKVKSKVTADLPSGKAIYEIVKIK